MVEGTNLAGSGDYAWVEDFAALGLCLALVERVDPAGALGRLVEDPLLGTVPCADARVWAEDQRDRLSAHARRTGRYDHFPNTIEAHELSGWTVTIEVNGFHATLPDVIRRLSAGTRAIVIYRNGGKPLMSFTYALDGDTRRAFDPLLFDQTSNGPGSGERLKEEDGLRFGLGHPLASAFALAERLSGVRLTQRNVEDRDDWIAIGHCPTCSQGRPESRSEHLAALEGDNGRQQAVEDFHRRRMWPDGMPSERVANLRGNAAALGRLDRELIDLIEAAGPRTQRDLANWAARRAYSVAGLAGWAADALSALDRREPLPPPFDQHAGLFDLLRRDPHAPHSLVTRVPGFGTVDLTTRNVLQQAMAIRALHDATDDDPLKAAIDTVYTAAVAYGGENYRTLLADVREFLATSH